MSSKMIKVIRALEKSITNVGVDKTISNLSVPDYSDSIADYIVSVVCKDFDVNLNLIKKSRKTSTKKIAAHIISYLLYYQANLTQSEIGVILSRSKASVNRYINQLHYLDTKFKHQSELKEKLEYFEKLIKEHKNNKL